MKVVGLSKEFNLVLPWLIGIYLSLCCLLGLLSESGSYLLFGLIIFSILFFITGSMFGEWMNIEVTD